MLKLATPADEDVLFSLIANFFNGTQYSSELFDETKIRHLIRYCSDLSKPESTLIVWVDNDEVVGLIAGQITEHVFNSNRVATELAWWVEPRFRKTEAAHQLLGAFEYWAEMNRCTRVQMLSLQNDYSKALERFYKRQGYVPAETSYVKEINNGGIY